jgi:hypothetical protein
MRHGTQSMMWRALAHGLLQSKSDVLACCQHGMRPSAFGRNLQCEPVRGVKHPRGMPLVTHLLASREQAWEPMASSGVNFCRNAHCTQSLRGVPVLELVTLIQPLLLHGGIGGAGGPGGAGAGGGVMGGPPFGMNGVPVSPPGANHCQVCESGDHDKRVCTVPTVAGFSVSNTATNPIQML